MQKNKNTDFSELTLALYGTECEITSYKKGDGYSLHFVLDGEVNGYITIDNLVTTIRKGFGKFDTRLLFRGDYVPRLITEGKIIELPKIRKSERGVSIAPPDDSYIRAISIRERELEARVLGLESQITSLCDSVYGKTIF